MTELRELSVADVRPNPGQPRRHFDKLAMAELTDSVRSLGVLEPIVVRCAPDGAGWQIVAGERRWRAATAAGLETIPAVVRDLSEHAAFLVSMVENVLRADMNPVEEADGYQKLIDAGMAVGEIAEQTGKSESAIRARLKLQRLAPAILDMVAKGHLDAWDAGHLARLSHEGQWKVVRAMTSGQLAYKNDLDRLTGHIALQEQQGAMFGTDEVETLSAERQRASRDLAAEIERALAALNHAADLLADGTHAANAELVAAKAEALRAAAAKLASAAHFQRMHHMAQQLAIAV